MVISIPQLFKTPGRDPNKLIGQPETAWLDFKGQPYRLNKSDPRRDKECFELARDVTALANASGGIILIGIRTELETSRQEEMAEALLGRWAGRHDH